MSITSKEIIKRIVHHDNPTRIGYKFLGDNPTDIMSMPSVRFINPKYDRYSEWGYYPEIVSQVPWFKGEVRVMENGNIYGRFDSKTKGECIKGVIQDGWELLESFVPPMIDEDYDREVEAKNYGASDKYLLAGVPMAVFAPLRDCRHMDNALMDVLLEPENICRFLDITTDISVEAIKRTAKNGGDGVMIFDDLGMQHALFFSPDNFRETFKPYYKKLADAAHNAGLDFFVHSCGKVTDLIPDFIDAGVDVFQFDQPELHTSELLAREFADKAAFYCPVDIQRIMPTGDKETIINGTLNMLNAFKARGGGLIVKDYGAWGDIAVEEEWAQWARDTVIKNAKL